MYRPSNSEAELIRRTFERIVNENVIAMGENITLTSRDTIQSQIRLSNLKSFR